MAIDDDYRAIFASDFEHPLIELDVIDGVGTVQRLDKLVEQCIDDLVEFSG